MVRILKYAKGHVVLFIIVTYLAILKSYRKVPIIRIDRFLPDMRNILLWTKIHGLEGEGQKYFIDQKCAFINCYFTTNKSLFGDLRYFDVILFNLQDVSEGAYSLPELRSASQKYIFVANDSSDNFPVCNPVFDVFFNWTWTYRFDSTISYRFITIYNTYYEELGSHFQWNYNMKPIEPSLKSQFVTKSKAAVIFLDKCKSRSKRENLIKDLQIDLAMYNLDVDVFGSCGPKQCKRKTMNPCFWRLRKTYFFYLAFEDSFDYDYITDIVLYAYNNNAVPIVYGGARYESYLPPGSYINALNTSTMALATSMHDIIKNKEKYYDFFRWKNHYTISKSPVLNACALCEILNSPARLVQNVVNSKFRMLSLCTCKQFAKFRGFDMEIESSVPMQITE
ncbi:alpha-(1,3)-fucosyltransferase C-like [Nymphalis io]|uniref:alpha-(1,3)-fucosyltransferase C-like n=1 Tax=Inachis io TaxID=171585 RepID=UPI002167AC4B|nr:alpha-(1,3)-fucosyltransferase C-like [Nymphalis io]